jgi:hypothetical protein
VGVDFALAKARLRAALEAWIPASGSLSLPNLSWELLDEYLPAPAEPNIARSDPNLLARTPFIEHDVLVSFAPLPVRIPETSERAAREVNYPRSELGTYARRTEYGVPTIYLGPHAAFLDSMPETWLDSPEGKFTLVHELGHVFGMAHEQQNPIRKGELNWRPIEDMREIARLRNTLTPVQNNDLELFIRSEITDKWPGDDTGSFSDWREPPVVQDGFADFDSVMAKPVYRCFLANRHGAENFDCRNEKVCRVEQSEFNRLARPTDSDLRQLVAMYGARPDGRQS